MLTRRDILDRVSVEGEGFKESEATDEELRFQEGHRMTGRTGH